MDKRVGSNTVLIRMQHFHSKPFNTVEFHMLWQSHFVPRHSPSFTVIQHVKFNDVGHVKFNNVGHVKFNNVGRG